MQGTLQKLRQKMQRLGPPMILTRVRYLIQGGTDDEENDEEEDCGIF